MKRKITGVTITALVLYVLLIPALLSAETAADFYKGRTLNIKTNSAGGSTDIITRAIAPFFEKELGVNVVITPARGNIAQHNSIYSAKPNGLTIGLIDGGGLRLPELYGEPGVKYDSSKFEWIAAFAHMPHIFYLSPAKPYRSIDDLKKAKNLKFVVPTPGGGYDTVLMLVSSVLDLDARITTGLSVGEIYLLLQKGEADAAAVTDVSSAPQAEQKKILPIFTVSGKSKMGIFKDLPAFGDLVQLNKKQKMIEDAAAIYKCVVAPPGTPKDRVDFLRKAFARIVQDKKATGVMQRVGVLDWGYSPGEEAMQMVMEQQKEAEGIKKELKNFIKKYRATSVF